jgi:hypothetical protein
MTIPWQSMTVEEFARFRRSLGERVIPANGVFWRQVRPLFYRPLLPYQEYPSKSVSGPFPAFFRWLAARCASACADEFFPKFVDL